MIRQGKSTLGHSIRLQTLTAIQWKQEPQQLAGVILSVVGDSPGPNVTEDHEHLGPINMALQRNQALQAVIPSQLFLSQCQVLETLANLRLTAVLMSPNITKTYQKQTNNLASGDLPPPTSFLNSCSGPSVGPSTRTWKPKPCSAKATFRSNSELSELGSMGPVGPGPRSSTEAADADATAPMGSMGRVALPRRVLVVVVWGRSGNPKGGLPKENINI